MLALLKKKRVLRVIEGLILSVGSPIGWVVIQSLIGIDPIDDMLHHGAVYLYMAIGTAIVFALFGYYVGSYEEKIENLALIDPLTGLYNNRYFHERLHQEFALCKRNEQQLSLVLFDLDHFKQINDQHGHLAGDRVLREVAHSMRKNSRESETIARVGGEEICVILPDCDREQALKAAQRFRIAIAQISGEYEDGDPLKVTASAGVASTSDAHTNSAKGTEWDLYADADKAMYQAKANGRNQIAYLRSDDVVKKVKQPAPAVGVD